MFPDALNAGLPAPNISEETATAVDILRRFNRPGGIADTMAHQVAAAARASAASSGPETLAATFASTGPAAITALRDKMPTDSVSWPGADAPTVWGEAVRIALLESVVHLLDVLAAIAAPPDMPLAALNETKELLTAMTEPVTTLIEAATGRSKANPFPVLH
jgi:hypothetical protein